MTEEYTEDEHRIWRASQPQKMIVVKVVIKSDKGNVLLLKSNYKKTWQLPGGGVDDGESPEHAAVRETKEETGLAISNASLAIKGTIYKQDEEMLFIVYESTELIAEDTPIKAASDETTAYEFIDATAALPLMSDYYFDFWKQNYLEKF